MGWVLFVVRCSLFAALRLSYITLSYTRNDIINYISGFSSLNPGRNLATQPSPNALFSNSQRSEGTLPHLYN